jgi:hypothetical protein
VLLNTSARENAARPTGSAALITPTPFPRRLLVIPGNDNTGEHLSVFLDSPEACYTPAHLSPRAKFRLVLESSLGAEHDHVKGEGG